MATLTPSPALPPYSPAPPVPSYSPEPADDEERIELTPRAGAHPTGNYIKTIGRDSVVLAEQEASAEFPTYGRRASIIGCVSLEDRQSISEIVVKIKGKMDVMITEGVSLTSSLIHESHTLWSSEKSHTSTCPGVVPFSVLLPTHYQDANLIAHPLPPSYEIPCDTSTGVYFRSSYTLSVTITRTRIRKLQFLSKHKTIPIKFIYSPRMRPWRPIQPSSDFLFDVKVMPEEFRQVVWEITPRPNSAAQALDLHLFLPMVEIFGLADTIPFHVQLAGPVASLRHFFADPPGLAVSIVRQVVVDLGGRRAARNLVIGTARLSASPPGFGAERDAEAGTASLGWDGDVRCHADTLVGMFNAGGVRVRDFFVVQLLPRNLQTIQEFTTLRHSHPIKLVTDSWLDASSSAARDGNR
ncbi:hypothetical protein GGX14DRAFT_600022 [Mycena pura]|uniref:Uncharacterized protein n=1 Tax=Mycena pura TaxID=153505 RepID=A0AAD6UP73_9AGAR|nr:hypothetical protein GGX14DRAFT_600022 [Mycena pura]